MVLPNNLVPMMSYRDPTHKPEKHQWHSEFCSKVHILFLSQSSKFDIRIFSVEPCHYTAAIREFWSRPLKSVCAYTCKLPVQVSFWLLTLHHSLQSLQPGHGLTHRCLRHRVVSLGAHRSKCTVINRCSAEKEMNATPLPSLCCFLFSLHPNQPKQTKTALGLIKVSSHWEVSPTPAPPHPPPTVTLCSLRRDSPGWCKALWDASECDLVLHKWEPIDWCC